MPVYITCPFLEGEENENVEVNYIYNKKFIGLDINKALSVIMFYNKTKSEKLKNILIELVGKEMFDLIVKEYIEDVDEHGKISTFSTLESNIIAIDLKKALQKIIDNREEIQKKMVS